MYNAGRCGPLCKGLFLIWLFFILFGADVLFAHAAKRLVLPKPKPVKAVMRKAPAVLAKPAAVKKPPQTFAYTLAYGSRNKTEVMRVQKFLAAQGLFFGPISGNYLSQTAAAVRAFQKRERLPTSGVWQIRTQTRANALAAVPVRMITPGPSVMLPGPTIQTSAPPLATPGPVASVPKQQLFAALPLALAPVVAASGIGGGGGSAGAPAIVQTPVPAARVPASSSTPPAPIPPSPLPHTPAPVPSPVPVQVPVPVPVPPLPSPKPISLSPMLSPVPVPMPAPPVPPPMPVPVPPPAPQPVIIFSVAATAQSVIAKIDWQTNIPTESKVFVSSENGEQQVEQSRSGLSTRHFAWIENLTPETPYAFEIEAIADKARVAKSSGRFATSPAPAAVETIFSLQPREPDNKGTTTSKQCFDDLAMSSSTVRVAGVSFQAPASSVYIDTVKFKLTGSARYGIDFSNISVVDASGQRAVAEFQNSGFRAALPPIKNGSTLLFMLDTAPSSEGKTIALVIESPQDITFRRINYSRTTFAYGPAALTAFPLIGRKNLFVPDTAKPKEEYIKQYCQ